MFSNRLQKLDLHTTKFIDRIQKTTKVGLTLQTLLIDYKSQTYTTKFIERLQKTIKVGLRLQWLDLHYKFRVRVERSSKVSLSHPSHSRQIFDGEMSRVCIEMLQGPDFIFSLKNYRQRRAAEAKKYPICAF